MAIQLRLLGGLDVHRDGVRLGGPATQRHRLALLAFLSTCPGQNASRDKVIAYLWPETDTTRARHRLSVTLHVLRRHLGEEAVTSTGDSISLNTDAVWNDVAAFVKAVSDGQMEQAVSLYNGSFLDGFSLSGAREFERWIDTERERLARMYRSALENLIQRTSNSADQQASVGWWKLLSEHDPYAAPVAIGLMQALAAVGDVAGAVRHAQAYATLLKGDLDLSPDPEVLDTATRLSAASVHRSIARETDVRPENIQPLVVHPRSLDAAAEFAPVDDPTPSDTPTRTGWRGRPLTIVIASTIVLGVATTLGLYRNGTSAGVREPVIGVVAFTVSTGVGAASWGDTLAARIHQHLAQIPGLTIDVVPGSNSDRDRRRFGAPFTSVIDGSLDRRGNVLQLHAQLSDVETTQIQWSQTLERTREDVLDFIDEVSFAIADSLRMRLAAYDPNHPDNDRSYDRFLEGVYSHRKFTRPDIWKALQLYREAYEEDTTFALAQAISANAYIDLLVLGLAPQIAFEQVRGHVLRALELDSMLPEAQAALGYLQVWGDRDFKAGERSLQKTIMLQPTLPQARTWYAWYTLAVRNWKETAVANLRMSMVADPLNTARSYDVEWGLYRAGWFEDAIEQNRRTWALDPEVAALFTGSPLAHSYRELGRYEEAVQEYLVLQERLGYEPVGLGITYARMGRMTDARRILADAIGRVADGGGSALAVARIFANLDEPDSAFAWLERSEQLHPDQMLGINADPPLAPLRDDPRYVGLTRRIGLSR